MSTCSATPRSPTRCPSRASRPTPRPRLPRAIVEELAGREITEPVWSNTCYALAGEDYGLFVADVFRIMDGKIGRTNTRARYQYLKAQPAEQALAAQYLHSWMNTISADSFG